MLKKIRNESDIPEISLDSKESLKKINAFDQISENSLNYIWENGKVIDFKEGWPISHQDQVGSNVYFILNGIARLIGRDNDEKITTICKLYAGDCVGLASIVRGEGCEEVSASTELRVFSLRDDQILNLYNKESKFKSWCNKTIFPSEIAFFANKFVENYNKESNLMDIYSELNIQNKVKIINNENFKTNEEIIFVGSKNIEKIKIGELITKQINISNILETDPRYICIKETDFNQLKSTKSQKTINTSPDLITNNIEKTTTFSIDLPEKSSLIVENYYQKTKNKIISGEGQVQVTLACLKMLTDRLNMPFRKDTIEKILKEEYRKNNNISSQVLSGILSIMGLYTSILKIPKKLGTRVPNPSIIVWKNSFALVERTDSKGLFLSYPEEGEILIKPEELDNAFNENIEIITVEKSSITPNKKFSFQWFLPSIKRYKSSLLLVLLSSFIVQLFGLANPLLIQVIIDKVITQRSLDTLQVLGIALVFVTFLGGILGSLRTFLFTETTNRIDTRLASEVIDHLLRVPLKYFDRRPVGELGSRVSELEKIREFLTGQALTTLLDAVFSVIYIVVMVLYSWKLTFIALAVVPIQIGLTLLGAPLIRSQIRGVANQNAMTQSHLVEILTGIQTVKAQNIETVSRWKWQDLYSKYISKSFERTITGTTLGQTSQVLQQLSQLLVLWVGASMVLGGLLSLGQLIAFRIISSYVTQPLLRLSSIWQNIQELRVSFERLADIIDTPEESDEKDKNNITLPSIIGNIEFRDVTFSFTKGASQILKRINLQVNSSEFIGIAGQSGSGKSTLMKLLPRLYNLDSGKIIIDEYDISKVELYSLRKQIGIVPQEPLLFSGSVSENIGITDPNVGENEIVKAAKIANAHDFIMDLPDGYSTDVGERGSRLSGGQRQRIAIARTLVTKPKLLIMDEATSALDYDSERKVCENLKKNCKDVTVFFITHRLSTIKNADRIIMMSDGSISEIGTHNDLMKMMGRYYALYRQQEANSD